MTLSVQQKESVLENASILIFSRSDRKSRAVIRHGRLPNMWPAIVQSCEKHSLSNYERAMSLQYVLKGLIVWTNV
jgi:hypothetical protein